MPLTKLPGVICVVFPQESPPKLILLVTQPAQSKQTKLKIIIFMIVPSIEKLIGIVRNDRKVCTYCGHNTAGNC